MSQEQKNKENDDRQNNRDDQGGKARILAELQKRLEEVWGAELESFAPIEDEEPDQSE